MVLYPGYCKESTLNFFIIFIFQDISIMEIAAKDGDTANPRPVLLTLDGDIQKYFKLIPEKPIGRATLVTSNIPIDRESDLVVQNGGVYSFFVKVSNNSLNSILVIVLSITIILIYI